jgi:hypothetical protein
MAAKSKTLFAYVDGRDIDEKLVAAVEARLDALVANRKWISKDVWVVNQNEPPHWDLGLNLAVPAKKNAKWADDVVAIAKELAVLHRETKARFVIGIAAGDETTDLFTIDSDAPDLEKLRAACDAAS